MFAVMSSTSTPADLVDGLGERWQIFDNGVKPYACGVVIHPAIDAVRDLAVRKGLTADRIEKIRLRVHPLVRELTGKTDPRTGLEGKFSVTFACSIALLDGRAGEAEFSDTAVVPHRRPCADGAHRSRPRSPRSRTPRPGRPRSPATVRRLRHGSITRAAPRATGSPTTSCGQVPRARRRGAGP